MFFLGEKLVRKEDVEGVGFLTIALGMLTVEGEKCRGEKGESKHDRLASASLIHTQEVPLKGDGHWWRGGGGLLSLE